MKNPIKKPLPSKKPNVDPTSSSRKNSLNDHNLNQRERELPLLFKIANAEDQATGDAYELFEFRKVRNGKGTLRVPRQEARDLKKMKSVLTAKNGDAIFFNEILPTEVEKVINGEPAEYWLYAPHVGWLNDRRTYILQNAVFGRHPKDFKMYPPLWLNERQGVTIRQEGSLEDWQKEVAGTAQYSSILMLIMSAAFAAPLLKFVGLQSFMVNLFGLSRAGKTTALLASTSIIGIGRENGLTNWNTTDGGFSETARLFNDSLMPLNELGLMKGGKKKEAYPRIRQLIYWFSEGRDTNRNSASAYSTSNQSSEWSGILVSTAENSIEYLAQLADERRDPGEYARSSDVPANFEGNTTIFDRYPPKLEEERRDRWARRRLHSLRVACQTNHGWAIKTYVEYLIKHKGEVEGWTKEYVADFLKKLQNKPDEGALLHSAQNFALIYAGGMHAIDAGIVFWDRELLREAIERCFQASIKETRLVDETEMAAREILKKQLVSLNLPEKQAGHDLKARPAIGFKTSSGDHWICSIRSAEFTTWFPSTAHLYAALRWLDRTGRLRKRDNADEPNGTNKNWAEKTVKWTRLPDQKFRAICFKDDFSA